MTCVNWIATRLWLSPSVFWTVIDGWHLSIIKNIYSERKNIKQQLAHIWQSNTRRSSKRIQLRRITCRHRWIYLMVSKILRVFLCLVGKRRTGWLWDDKCLVFMLCLLPPMTLSSVTYINSCWNYSVIQAWRQTTWTNCEIWKLYAKSSPLASVIMCTRTNMLCFIVLWFVFSILHVFFRWDFVFWFSRGARQQEEVMFHNFYLFFLFDKIY